MVTKPYRDMRDLYVGDVSIGDVEFVDEQGTLVKIDSLKNVKTQRGVINVLDVKEGDEIWEIL